LFNGYDQLYNATIPVIDYWRGSIDNYHFYLDVGSVVPGYAGAFSSALNGLLYAVEGDPRSAARELVFVPLPFVGLKGEGMLAKESASTIEKAAVKGVDDAVKLDFGLDVLKRYGITPVAF